MAAKQLVNTAHLFDDTLDDEFALMRVPPKENTRCVEHEWDPPQDKLGMAGKVTCTVCGLQNEFLPLFRWLEEMLRRLPSDKLSTDDAERAYRLMRFFHKAAPGTTVSIRTDDYKWLQTILFDEKAGAKLNAALLGSWGMAIFGFPLGITAKGLLEGSELDAVGDGDDDDENPPTAMRAG